MEENIVQNIQNDSIQIKRTLLGSEKGWELTFDAIPDLIAILDRDHRVVKVNRAMAEKLMKSPDDCIGVLCYQVVHLSDTPPENCPHKKLLTDGFEHISEVEEKNLGGYFVVTASPIKDDDGTVIGSIHIAHDITERKEIEKKLEKALEEKDMLMKETYHRVKNNLMVISSLLNLQSRYIKDKDTKNIFKESQNRAKSMAMIHEKLYRSGDLKNLNFTEYIENLSNDLYRTYTIDKSLVNLELDIEDIKLDVEISVPLGLILNELLTNSLKHAFPEGTGGVIKVDMHRYDGGYKLSVSDNGRGFPQDLDYRNTATLGMLIVNSLTEQIDGELSLDRSKGTKFTVKFKEKEY
ncbi:MAG: histidine kinase dimerization/phosphoacceptor domain -containing protein [Methanobacterium sp.]